jgi:hypothetical protein
MKSLVNSGEKVELRPPISILVAAAAAIAFSIMMVLWSFQRIDRLTLVGFIVMPSAILLSFLLGVDALQRKYVFFKDRIEVRYLFRWKKHEIHGNVEVSSNKSGQVIIEDGRKSMPLLRVPREYNPNGQLEQRLRNHFVD